MADQELEKSERLEADSYDGDIDGQDSEGLLELGGKYQTAYSEGGYDGDKEVSRASDGESGDLEQSGDLSGGLDERTTDLDETDVVSGKIDAAIDEKSHDKFDMQDHPALIGKYRIVSQIGEGGQGKVFCALDADDRMVAIKYFDFNSFETWKAEELIHREAEILKTLHLKGVPEFIEYIEKHPSYYIVESYIDAPSLDAKIKKGMWVDMDEILKVLKGVAKILFGLQRRVQPVYHRDIKPANILLMGDEVYLVDFGSVAALKQKTNNSTVTGTSGYAAPEQYYGKVSSSADIFGLGTTMLHLITGVAPWEVGMNGLTLDYASHLPKGISKDFTDILLDMINPNPDERIQDAEELLDRVKEFEKGEKKTPRTASKKKPGKDVPLNPNYEKKSDKEKELSETDDEGGKDGEKAEEVSSLPVESIRQGKLYFIICCIVFFLCLFVLVKRPRMVVYLSFPMVFSALCGTWMYLKYMKSVSKKKRKKLKRDLALAQADDATDHENKQEDSDDSIQIKKNDNVFIQDDMILSAGCPALRGFKDERQVIEEATLYYMNYGADGMKYARNHFFMFDPEHSAEDRHLEYLFVEKLLSLGVKTSVNYRDFERLSVLEKMERPEYESKMAPLLSYFTDPEILELLISYGVDVNEQSLNGETPLSIFASRWGKLEKAREIFELLISHGANVKGNSDILTNISQVDGFDYLISKGAVFDPNAIKKNRQMNPLIYHVKNNHLGIVRRYIELGVDVNLMDEKNVPVIIYSGSKAMFDLLHDSGAVINKSIVKKAVEKGENPLFHAVKNDDITLVRLWLSMDADVNGVSGKSDPYPIFFGKSVEMLELLSANGADIHLKCGEFYHTGLYYASSAAAAEWMIDAGLSVRARDEYQNTPLHRVQLAEIVPILVTNGADVNARNLHGDTPLNRAVRNAEMADMMQYDERVDIVDWLIRAGADVSIIDKTGHSPLYHAGSIQLIRMLLGKREKGGIVM